MSVSAAPAPAAPPARARVARARPLPLPWEILGVVVGSIAVTCWAFRDMFAQGLTTTVSGDLGDPLYFAWQLAWVRHALANDPGTLWTTPAFRQAPDNLAFTDTVLGYTPLGLFVGNGQAGALALLNLATLASWVLAVVGAYALARALGTGRLAALVAGGGFGFAPWRLQQIIHINVISTGGIALTLALLARGSGWSMVRGWEPRRMSWRWIAAGWFVAAYQLLFGFATGIWFVYTVGVAMLLWCVGWLVSGRRRARLPRSVLLAYGVGGLGFGLTLLLLLRPYFRVLAAHPEAKRGENWLPLFAPPWQGLLTAPDTDWFWGERQLNWRAALTWQPEMVLSPGVVLLVLALTGVVFSVFPWRRRLVLVAVTALLTVLAMGTAFPWGHGEWTYLPLYRHLPGWSALRTTGRMMIWVTLGLCVLAAGAIARFHRELSPAGEVDVDTDPDPDSEVDPVPGGRGPGGFGPEGEREPSSGHEPVPEPVGSAADPATGRAAGRARERRGPWSVLAAVATAVVTLVPAAVVVAEGLNTTHHWTVATAPVTLRALPQPVLLLPSDTVGDYHMMLWGTEGWPVLANGSSGFDPADQQPLRDDAKTFPDAASVAALRGRGILTVVIVRSRIAAGSPWAGAVDKPVDALGITRSDLGDAMVYNLRPTAG